MEIECFDFISPQEELPKFGSRIIIRYHKGNDTRWGKNGLFITEGIFEDGCDGGCWYDYTNRLLSSSQTQSKNVVRGWAYL